MSSGSRCFVTALLSRTRIFGLSRKHALAECRAEETLMKECGRDFLEQPKS